MKPEITIVVRDGCVDKVLSNTKDVCVQILDMDTCDAEEEEALNEEYETLEKALRRGELYDVV